MGRAPCCEKNGLKKGPWTTEEDQKLIDYIQKHGHGSWRSLPKNAGLARCGKSCRLRWTNYLRPDIKRGRFSFEEEETIIQLHSIMGNKWSAIAARLPGRTDNEIKNYWNTHIRKRLLRMGIDPVTHSARLDLLDLSSLLINPPMYNNTPPDQFDVSRMLAIEPFVNSELLRLATTLLSPHDANSNIFNHGHDLEEHSFPFRSLQANQLQNQIHELQACTTSGGQLFDAAQNMTQLQQDDLTNFLAPRDLCYQSLDQAIQHVNYCDNTNFGAPNYIQSYNLMTSVVSTPSSSMSQLNSSPTYVTSSTEDERESYCSELLKFHVPDLLDVSDYL